MNKILPTLRFLSAQDLYLLNVHTCLGELDAPVVTYRLRPIDLNQAPQYMTYLLSISHPEEVPYGVIADYKLLAFNDFSFVKAFRNNLLTTHVPLIAIADAETLISAETLKIGIDDCYQKPFDCRLLRERIDFLNRYKPQLDELRTLETAAETAQKAFKLPFFKRLIDILGAGFAIILLSPLFLLIALLIKLESRGPIIYKSKRSGIGYQVFDFFKFRSMYIDADKQVEQVRHLNQYGSNTLFLKVKADPRITRVGRFIRKTSLDELPQLFNVLRGDMSLVGNRPLPLYEAEQLTSEDMTYRFMAPAGITGLWQVTKRGGKQMSAQERIDLDVFYAQNHSFWYDLRIVMKTPFALIQREDV